MLELDQIVRHQIDLERFKVGVSRKYIANLNSLSSDVFKVLNYLDSSSPRYRSEVKSALVKIDSLINKTFTNIGRNFLLEIKQWLKLELNYISKGEGFQELTEEESNKIIPIILSSLILGKSFSLSLSNIKNSLKTQIRATVMASLVDNNTVSQISSKVRGTKSNNYRDGVFNKFTNYLNSLLGTAIQTYAMSSRGFILDKFLNGKFKYRWISVMDSRTSTICRARSNKVYTWGEGPLPPAHNLCRSSIIKHDSNVVPTPSYSEWLRKQPRDVVEDILGKGKAKIFLDNPDLKLDKFVNEKGRELTLKQLRERLN